LAQEGVLDIHKEVNKNHMLQQLSILSISILFAVGKKQWQSGNFDAATRSSKLSHKTIARLAGIGYIGKNNLLITEAYGCAFCMCTVLTNAPFQTEAHPPLSSQCGECDECRRICPGNALRGNEWPESTGREGVMDVSKCTCALKCMVHCSRTLEYVSRSV